MSSVIGIGLIFLIIIESARHFSSSEQIYNLEKFISENYFEKYDSLIDSKFNSFIENEIPHDLSKALQENNHATPASSVLHQNFIGEGSHRRLYSYLRFRVRPEFLSDLTRQSCVVVLIERLQSGVFADPFELQHLVQHGVFTRAAVFGDTNLELPSFQSNRSVVEIHIDVSSKVFCKNKNELEVDLEVPLHARYQVRRLIIKNKANFSELSSVHNNNPLVSIFGNSLQHRTTMAELHKIPSPFEL